MDTVDLLSVSSFERKQRLQKMNAEELIACMEKVLSSPSGAHQEVLEEATTRYKSSSDAATNRTLLEVLFKHLHRQDPSVQRSTMFLLLNHPQSSPHKVVEIITHPLVLKHAYPRWIGVLVHVSFLPSGKPVPQDALLWEAVSSTLRPVEWVNALFQEHEKQRFFKENRRDSVSSNASSWVDVFDRQPHSWQQACVNLWTEMFPQKSLVEEWEVALEKWLLKQHLFPSSRSATPRRI